MGILRIVKENYGIDGREIKVRGGILRKECAELMKNIKNWTPII